MDGGLFMANGRASIRGRSGHISRIVRDKNTDKSAFYGPLMEKSTDEQDTRHFLAGQAAPDARAMHALGRPTLNSYRVMIPGFWAPTGC